MTTSVIRDPISSLNERFSSYGDEQARFLEVVRNLRMGADRGPGILQVDPVDAPHPPTRRNYNYFDRLRAALAALPADRHSIGPEAVGDLPH